MAAPYETITAIIGTIRARQASGWCVCDIQRELPNGATPAAKATGTLPPAAAPGQRFQLKGRWEEDRYNPGTSKFAFVQATPDIPTDPRAMLAYAVELTAGLGEGLAAQIWEAYGAGWLDAAKMDPALSFLAKPLREGVASSLQATIRFIGESAAQAQANAWLLSLGCTPRQASLAWEEWRESTIASVSTNPFILCALPLVRFTDIDAGIRKRLGVPDDSPYRYRAGIMHALNAELANGDTVAARQAVLDAATALLRLPEDGTAPGALAGQLAKLQDAGEIVPLDQFLASAVDYRNETAIAEAAMAALAEEGVA